MAEPTSPEKAILVIGITYSNDIGKDAAVKILIDEFGAVDKQSESFIFDFTDYYKKEMGAGLKKIFMTFKEAINVSQLPDIKLFTNKIEQQGSNNGNRDINLDPGYITKDKLIVASCKPRPHRIYLDKGVYAHFMFLFKKNEIVSFRWTFPDYMGKENQQWFLDIRNDLIKD